MLPNFEMYKPTVQCTMCQRTLQMDDWHNHIDDSNPNNPALCPLLLAHKHVNSKIIELEQKEQHLKELEEENKIKWNTILDDHKQRLDEEYEKIKEQRVRIEMRNNPIHLKLRDRLITVSWGDYFYNDREPDNVLQKMFNGELPLKKVKSLEYAEDVYFIDCEYEVFKCIIEWLQFGSVNEELNEECRKTLIQHCQKFEMPNLKRKLESWKKMARLSPLKFASFINKSRAQQSKLFLSGLNLTELQLKETNLDNSEIVNSDLSGMDLSETSFMNCNLKGSNFSHCQLSGAKFQNSDLSDCNFSHSLLKNANFTKVTIEYCNLENCQFENCQVQTHFSKGNKLSGCTFKCCTFFESTFEEIDEQFFLNNILNTYQNCKFEGIKFSQLKGVPPFDTENSLSSTQATVQQLNKPQKEKVETIIFTTPHSTSFIIPPAGLFGVNDCVPSSDAVANITSGIITDASILTELCKLMNPKPKTLKLLYKGSNSDGEKTIDAKSFHARCDDQGRTLSIIKCGNCIFGGYTEASWRVETAVVSTNTVNTDVGRFKKDGCAFLFKVTLNSKVEQFKVKNCDLAIYVKSGNLVTFGNDLEVLDSGEFKSNFGAAYHLKDGLKYGPDSSFSYLSGNHSKIDEIEVFKVI